MCCGYFVFLCVFSVLYVYAVSHILHASILSFVCKFRPIYIRVTILIIYMKKLLDSDWLRALQFKCNTSAKSVTPVQKV